MRITLFLLLGIIIFLFTGGVEGSTHSYIVPIDYPTLQDAIDNVPPGSTIYVDVDQTISSEIQIHGKTLLTIVFRDSSVKTVPGYSDPSLIDIRGSRYISIQGLEAIVDNPSSFILSGVSIRDTRGVSIVDMRYSVLGIPSATHLRGVSIYSGAEYISIFNLRMTDITNRWSVVAIQFWSVSDDNTFLLDGLEMVNVTSLFQGVEGVTLISINLRGWSLHLKDLVFRDIDALGYSFFGVHIGNYQVIEDTEVVIKGLEASGVHARWWPEAINIWSISGVWRDSRLEIMDVEANNFSTELVGYAAIWVNIANYLDAEIELEDIYLEDIDPGPVNSIGIGFKLGMDFLPSSRTGLNLMLNDVEVDGASIGILVDTGNTPGTYGEDINILFKDVETEDVSTGMLLNLRWIINHRVAVENYVHRDRSPSIGLMLLGGSLGSDLNPVSTPHSLDELRANEDIYFAYSVLWRVDIDFAGPSIGITFYESVVDEFHSTLDPDVTIRSVWTLAVEVFSSYTGQGINNALVDIYYPDPALYSSGSTVGGLYQTVLDYIFTGVHVDDIYIEASRDGYTNSTSLPSYLSARYGDINPYNLYTFPSWYGRVVLTLPIMALHTLGFSHDGGLTLLTLDGETGSYQFLYSDKPHKRHNPPYIVHRIDVLRIEGLGKYTVIYVNVHYFGEVHPTVIYIYRDKGLVYSPGPVDFRGWINTG